VNGSEVTYARRSHNNDSMAIFMAIIKEYSIPTKILSSFTHSRIISDLYDFLSTEKLEDT